MTDLRRERVEIRNPKRDKPQVLPSSEVTVTTWSPEKMDAHLAKIGGGKAMEKEAVLTKEKLQDLTNQGFTAKEIADQTGKTVGTVNNYKYKWGVKKQSALEKDHDQEEMEDVQEAVVAPDFHEEKERHLKADIERLKSEKEQVQNERDTYKQAFEELKSDLMLRKKRPISDLQTWNGSSASKRRKSGSGQMMPRRRTTSCSNGWMKWSGCRRPTCSSCRTMRTSNIKHCMNRQQRY